MKDVATPSFLLDRNQSPHHATLRPSQAKLIADVDILFWIGPDMETFLVKPVRSLMDQSKAFPLIDVIRPELLRYSDGVTDPHIWLSTRNAISIAREIKTKLTQSDPENEQKYAENMKQFETEIQSLDQEIKQKLASVKSGSYLINHNALQYFERQFSVYARPVGTGSEEFAPGAKQIALIRKLAESGDYQCIFIGQGINTVAIRSVLAGTELKSAIIDPTGLRIPAGPDQYVAMMRNIADTIVNCSK